MHRRLCLVVASLLLGSGCTQGGTTHMSAEVIERVQTVVRVQWGTETASTGWVEFGAEETYGRQVESTADGTEHEVLLLGMPSNTTIHYRLIVDQGGDLSIGDDQVIRTGLLSSALPQITTEVLAPSASSGWTLLAVRLGLQGEDGGLSSALVALNRDGRVVWYWTIPPPLVPMRPRALRDGSGVLTNLFDRQAGEGYLVWVGWDGEERRTERVDRSHHDFVEHEDEAVTVLRLVDEEGLPAGSDANDELLRIDPDGTRSVVWSTW